MAQKVINGDRYDEFLIKTVPGESIPVEINNANLNIDAAGIEIKNDSGNPIPTITGLSIPEHDYIDLSYVANNLTGVVYKNGGVSGEIVATLTLAYDGSNKLVSIIKE